MAYIVVDEAGFGGGDLADTLGFTLLSAAEASYKNDALKLIFSGGLWRAHLPDGKTVVAVDFTDAKLLARIKPANLASEHVVRAILGRKKTTQALNVLDATAGFGQDSFLLAASGCQVIMVEQVPLLHYFLRQAIDFSCRDVDSQANGQAIDVLNRLELIYGNSIDLMKSWDRPQPDIIYLDPMYAQEHDGKGLKKSAAVKKNMAFLQVITQQQHGINLSGRGMLEAALDLAGSKVVVKRAPNAPYLDNKKPASSIVGKAARFDIYPR